MKNKRREFLKNISAMSGAAILGPISTIATTQTKDADPVSRVNPDGSISINILQTTDVHCQIDPHDEMFWESEKPVFRKTGGYAQIAGFFKKERVKDPETFIIDTGDMFQGSELSMKTTGKCIVPILNAMGYDLFLPGNWEVIYYKKVMQELLGALNAPKICANMYHDLGGGNRGELIFPPYHVRSIKGVKIGFIGYTDPLVPTRQPPNLSKGIAYSKPEENLANYVDVLRNQEKCAVVIIIAHLGLSQQIGLADMEVCKGVDYILGGDTHERVRVPIPGKYAKVVEPGAFGSFVGKLTLTVKDGKMIRDEYVLHEVESGKWPADTAVAKLIDQVEVPYRNEIETIRGYSTIPLYRYFVVENPIDTMVLDALKWRMPEIDIVLSNGFRFCPPRVTPDSTGNIPITEGYIFDMLPFDSNIKTGKVSGQQIMDWLEKDLNNIFAKNSAERIGGWMVKFKGMKISFYAYHELGNRIQEITIGGRPLDAGATYTICACDRDGDPVDVICRIRKVADTKVVSYTLHSTMRDYLAAHSPVTPLPPENAKILDAPRTLLTQVRGVDYQFR